MTKLELDYQQTSEMFKLLAEIRFKLLALVPTIAGIGIGLVGNSGADTETQLMTGLLGFVATLGILLYELRNSELYNWTIHRAKHLERELGLSCSALGAPQGGVFGERAPVHRRFAGLVPIKHDPALGLVYGAALAAWAWLLLRGLLPYLGNWSDRKVFWAACAGAVGTGVVVTWQVHHHDRQQRMPKEVGNVEHFTSALAEIRCELARLTTTETPKPQKKKRKEKQLDGILARCRRVIDQTPRVRKDHEPLRHELCELGNVLASLEAKSVVSAQTQLGELTRELSVDTGDDPTRSA